MTKRLIVGMWRGQYFFIQPGACEKVNFFLQKWFKIGYRLDLGAESGCGYAELSRSSQLLKSRKFCILFKKLSESSQYGGSKAIVIFSAIAYSLLLFLLLRFSILFLFLSGVYHPVFINLWHWPCSYALSGAQVATPCAKLIFLTSCHPWWFVCHVSIISLVWSI